MAFRRARSRRSQPRALVASARCSAMSPPSHRCVGTSRSKTWATPLRSWHRISPAASRVKSFMWTAATAPSAWPSLKLNNRTQTKGAEVLPPPPFLRLELLEDFVVADDVRLTLGFLDVSGQLFAAESVRDLRLARRTLRFLLGSRIRIAHLSHRQHGIVAIIGR